MTFADHLFERHRFDRWVMVLCVRWYVSDTLSWRDLAERMAERRCRWPTPRLGAEC
jgi:transposase-like protein